MESPQNNIDFLPILDVILRRILWLLGLTALGLGLGFLFSVSVTPLYESVVVMYPSNSNSRDKQLEDFSYGHEVHAERLMQLLTTNTLLDSLDANLDLAGHYGIDRSKATWYDELLEMWRRRMTVHKNKYVSVSISAIDADPVFGARLANEAARLVNVINADIVKNAALASLQVVEREYQRRLGMVHSMTDSIRTIESTTMDATKGRLTEQVRNQQRAIQVLRDSLDGIRRKYNIYDFGYQINVLNEHVAEARANYLQETGYLEALGQDAGAPDSVLRTHRALQLGAKMRMDHFTVELQRLADINKRYLQLEAQLNTANELNLSANEELLEYQSLIDPNFESRKLNRLEEDYRWDQLQTQELHEKYQTALNNYLDPVPAAIIVSDGRASYKRIFPHTLVNLALGGFGGFFFGLLLFTLVDRRKGGRV